MKRLFDFVYGNFITLWNNVVRNLQELSTVQQAAFALAVVALVFIAVMLLIYILRINKYRSIKKIENVDVVFFNTVWEFGPYKKGKQGEALFIALIPFTFVINLVVKAFMFREFSAINSSDYITRRMLENMQLENMRMKDKNKELLKMIDEAGLNRKPRKQTKPAPRPKRQEVPKETPIKEEIKVVKETEPEVVKEEAKAPIETPKKEAAPVKETPKAEAVKTEEVKEEPKVELKEEAVTSSSIVTDDDKEPEVILANNKVEEPVALEKEILEAEIIDPEKDNIDELIEDVKVKETRGKA